MTRSDLRMMRSSRVAIASFMGRMSCGTTGSTLSSLELRSRSVMPCSDTKRNGSSTSRRPLKKMGR